MNSPPINLEACPDTIGKALVWARRILKTSGVQNYEMEALWLLGETLQRSPRRSDQSGEAFLFGNEPLLPEARTHFINWIEQRSRRVPLAYLLGTQEFMGRLFTVDSSVLIPRPETQTLVETAYWKISSVEYPSVLDVGCGSGCVSISLAHRMIQAVFYACDISQAALSVAKKNAEAHRIASRFTFYEGDLLSPLPNHLRLDLIVSNLPYVASGELPALQPELQFEPRAALDGGKEGLNFIRTLIAVSPSHLKRGGVLALEIGERQAFAVQTLMRQSGFSEIETAKDSFGKDRVVSGRHHG